MFGNTSAEGGSGPVELIGVESFIKLCGAVECHDRGKSTRWTPMYPRELAWAYRSEDGSTFYCGTWDILPLIKAFDFFTSSKGGFGPATNEVDISGWNYCQRHVHALKHAPGKSGIYLGRFVSAIKSLRPENIKINGTRMKQSC